MVIRLAIDPGDVHVGWCLDHGDGTGPECEEMTPAECIDRLINLLSALSHEHDSTEIEVIVEEFVLYPGQDQRNVGNRMATSELIGKIEWICQGFLIGIIRQAAGIKKPTRRQLRGRGIKQIGRGTHMRDAELHYYYRKLRADDAAAAEAAGTGG